ncbi:VWA domain-containing protein [Porticoccaceae bacterium]|nr:VWA domain-containing protein [Porticoccaceae bacterium]
MAKRRESAEASIAFLDVISCGFGAIVLLLIIARVGDPSMMDTDDSQLINQIKDQQETLFSVRGESIRLESELKSRQQQLSDKRDAIARLQAKLASVSKQAAQLAQSQQVEKEQLQLVLQVLTEEMQRLLGDNFQSQDDLVAGIPADSDYIIFVIDTSGSMQTAAWARVQREMLNILDVYPEVTGIQVLNDMGQYMFNKYQEQWIPDSPAMRKSIIDRLAGWAPFSNSSPVEGINTAIQSFYKPGRKISIYTLGDDFQGRSIRQVVKTVDQLNKANASDERLVRIHALGFPVHLREGASPSASAIRFAALMRELSYNNGGTFIGLNELE